MLFFCISHSINFKNVQTGYIYIHRQLFLSLLPLSPCIFKANPSYLFSSSSFIILISFLLISFDLYCFLDPPPPPPSSLYSLSCLFAHFAFQCHNAPVVPHRNTLKHYNFYGKQLWLFGYESDNI